jgi:hypothetical protein
MNSYLLLFSPSELGTHIYHIDASSDEEAKAKAIKRLESSPMVGMQYSLIKAETVVDWTRWNRKV